MSSDGRRTGGLANRAWNGGRRVVPQYPPGAIERLVRAYREECGRWPQLDRRYHPTADGAVKMIVTYSSAQADEVRTEFERQAGHV